ncbi:MAG: hypothetical protein KBS84_10135 [Treponema sp.]|nr:hypothetical protein [Candidatus Treponema scatequi]
MKRVLTFISILLIAANCFAKSMDDKVTVKSGIVAIEYVPYNGGIFMYAEGINKKYVPLIDTIDYAASSFIGIAVDKTYYNLRNSGGVKYSYSIENNSLVVTYKIKNQVEVNITYSISKKDVITVKYAVKNIDGVKHAISLKAIYDTVLGEGKGGAYVTAAKNAISTEYIISDFAKHKYITSTDGKLAIRFLFDDVYQKYAYKTVIAAKPFFDSSVFEGRFVEGRSFNTVLSYNNSCVGCFFKTLKLNAGDEKVVEQKIQVLRNEFAVPETDDDDDFEEVTNGDEEYYSKTEIKPASDLINEKHDFGDSAVKDENAFAKNDFTDEMPKAEKTDKSAVIDFDNVSSNDKSAREYTKKDALDLIEKINALDDDGANTSQEEVLRLQIELERVLKSLKNK